MPAPHESVTLTFLFTDLVESTQLLQRLGEERARVVFERHHRQLSDAVAAHGGEELEWLGDGMLAAFVSSVQAIRCAVSMQKATRRLVAGQRIAIRIGVHTGEAMRRQGGYFGNTLVVARRLCDTAKPGQILSTSFVASMLAGRQFSFQDAGELTLKGIDEPIHVVEVSGDPRQPRSPIAPSPPPTPAPSTARRPLRAPALAALAAVGLAGLIGGSLAFLGQTPSASQAAPTGHRDAVVQLLPLLLWRDPIGASIRFEPLGWASGTLIDERGLIVTSQEAIDPLAYRQPFDAIGVAIADTSGLASRPEYLAQVMGVGEAGSGLAVLLITSTLDGQVVSGPLRHAGSGDATTLGRGDALELVGFQADAERPLRAPQTSRSADAQDVAFIAGQPALIETGAQLAAGEVGGGAFAEGALMGVVVPSPSRPGTAAVRPVNLATTMLDRVRSLLDGRPVGGSPTITFDAPEVLSPHTLDWLTTATIEGLRDGATWAWSCTGPDGMVIATAWPPLQTWNIGSSTVRIELPCRRDDGFELDAGSHRVRFTQRAGDADESVLGEAFVEVASGVDGYRAWRASGRLPTFEIDVPDVFRCASCELPFRVEGLLVLEMTDAQLAFRTYAGTSYEASTPSDLATMLADLGIEFETGPRPIEVDGRPGLRLEAPVGRDSSGSGPFEGARFLAGTRGTWTFISVDGIAVAISAETLDTTGWEERMDTMDEVVTGLRFR